MTDDNTHFPSWIFIGSPQIAVDFLESMYSQYDMLPGAVITSHDTLVGRKRVPTPTPVKVFAETHGVPCHTVDHISQAQDLLSQYDLALVFAYGALIPQEVLDAPRCGILNIHPSLLPEYRGPSPITTAILEDARHTGVTLMKLVSQMDAGPIIAQSPVDIAQWEKYYVHEQDLAAIGARLFRDYAYDYTSGRLFGEEQNHERATYCPKYHKEDMEIKSADEPYTQYRTYCAFPKPFFINTQGKRFVVTRARYEDGEFIIERVIPEGKQERDYLPQDRS